MTLWDLIKDRPGMPEDVKIDKFSGNQSKYDRDNGFNIANAAWLAFLKGVEVKWPEKKNYPNIIDTDYTDGSIEGYNEAIDACQTALTQVLKVKEGG